MTIQQALLTINTARITEAANRLAQAKMLIWYGIGESGFLAQIANHKCLLLGISSSACTDSVNFEGFSHTINDSQALVIISRTGNANHIIKPLQTAQEKGIYTVGISSEPLSKLAQDATTCLIAPTTDALFKGRRISIRAGHELMINALILKTAETLGIQLSYGLESIG